MRRVTQKAKIAAARAILDSHLTGERFGPDALAELSNLTGIELRQAFKVKNPKFPNDKRHLHVLAYDWSEPQQWSWVKAIQIASARDPEEARATRRRSKVLLALRQAIQPDLRDFRSAANPQKCANCDATDDLTTDHVKPTFHSIAMEFIEKEGHFLLMEVPGCCDCIFDYEVEARWVAYHASRAIYQLLCRRCNSSKGAR